MPAPLPPNETERLQTLARYEVLDTPPDAALDRLTALAIKLFDVPIALVSLVDRDRQWFKSRQGLVPRTRRAGDENDGAEKLRGFGGVSGGLWVGGPR